MNNKFKNKMVGIGTIPRFPNGVPFYIHVDVTTMRNEVRFQQTQMFADKQLGKTKEEDEDSIEIELLAKICEDQDSLIREQATQICELQNLLAGYEQEIYEKDQIIQQEAALRSRSDCIEEAYRGGYQ